MKKLNGLIILLVLVWIILAVIFGIYDLEISKKNVNQNSGWAIFCENYGMIPGLLVILSGIYIYYLFIKMKSDLFSYVQKVVFFLVSSGLIFYLFDIFLHITESKYFITLLIFSFSISILIFISLHLVKPLQNLIAIKYGRIVLGMALFGYVIFVQGVKYFWGRVRFRELDAVFSQFTPWYLPQGITGFDSFPSGHAAMGWILLPLLIIFINRPKWVRVFVYSLIIIWGIVLPSSRVVVGAHYASDILFGSFFIIIFFFFLLGRYKEE